MDRNEDYFEDKLDRIIKNAVREKPDELEHFKDMRILPNDIMIKRVIKTSRKRNSNKSSALKRALVMACLVVLVSTFLTAVIDKNYIQACKFQMLKVIESIKGSITSISLSTGEDPDVKAADEKLRAEDSKIEKIFTLNQAQESVGYHIPSPEYLPEGYKEDHVKWTRYKFGNETIELVYTDEQKNTLTLLQKRNLEEGTQGIASNDKGSKPVTVMGVEARVYSTDRMQYGIWVKDGFEYSLFMSLTEEEFINVIESIK